MPKTLAQDTAAENRAEKPVTRAKSFRKAISDHVAYALLIYTGLNIVVTMKAVQAGKGAILPYLALIVLVAAIIPACRWFEKRWEDFGPDAAHDPAMTAAFRRDIAMIWAGAIGLPLIVTGLCKLIALAF